MKDVHVLTAVGLGALFQCNYHLTPFAPKSLSLWDVVVDWLCSWVVCRKMGFAGRLTHFNIDLLESSALWHIKHRYAFSIPMVGILKNKTNFC